MPSNIFNVLNVTGPTGIMTGNQTFAAVNYAGNVTVVLPYTGNVEIGTMVVVKEVGGIGYPSNLTIAGINGDMMDNMFSTIELGNVALTSYTFVCTALNNWSIITVYP